MDNEYDKDLLDKLKELESRTEKDKEFEELRQKRKKLHDIWCTIYIGMMIVGVVCILLAWVFRAENLPLIVNYTMVIFFAAAVVLAIVVKSIDKYYRIQMRKIDKKKVIRFY